MISNRSIRFPQLRILIHRFQSFFCCPKLILAFHHIASLTIYLHSTHCCQCWPRNIGGATGGCEATMYPPLLRPVLRRGYNAIYVVHLWGVATGGISVYIPPKSVYLKFSMWLFCLLDPGQIRYRAIYTHPNQIPGYASGIGILQLAAPQKFHNSHSALALGNAASFTVCYYNDTENLT